MSVRFVFLLLVVVFAGACGDGPSGQPVAGLPISTASTPQGQTTSPIEAASETATTTTTSPESASSEATAITETTATTETTAVTTASTTTGRETASTETTSVPFAGALEGGPDAAEQVVHLRFESKVGDVTTTDLAAEVLAVLNDPRGWPQAGFRFVADDDSPFRVVLAEGDQVDGLCLPLQTHGTVSCQNGPVVALNADRWRSAVEHWDAEIVDYRGYLINHEVGHLLGQRHPTPRCPVAGRPAGVMEQQTGGLKGCIGNAWPRDWEIELARQRPVVYAPLPDWGPDPVPVNGER